MKRIAIISLIAAFLTTNYAYATIPIEELSHNIKKLQYHKLTQKEVESLIIDIISTMDLDNQEQTLFFLESLPQVLETQPLQGCFFESAIYSLLRIFFISLALLEPLVGVPIFLFIGLPIIIAAGLLLVVCQGG